ncbi:MAG: nucleotide exchange factor GrpE [bacterium]
MNKTHKEKNENEIKKTDSGGELKIPPQILLKEKEKAEDYYKQLITLKAEFENYRKRSEKDINNLILTERKNILAAFLPVMDNLLKIKELVNCGHTDLNKSVEIVMKELEKIFAGFKIKRMACAGEKFSPAAHNAVLSEKTGKFKAGEIIKVIDNGYYCGEDVLKPANVVVAENEEPETKDGTEKEGGK